jgi:hypothetical protein
LRGVQTILKGKIQLSKQALYNTVIHKIDGITPLTLDNIDVEATIKTVRQLLAEEAQLSPALRSILEVMILLIKIMDNRLSLNSRNSSQPESLFKLIGTRNIGQSDVRCYQPPVGYKAVAELIDVHPITQQQFDRSEWWIFLTP